MQGHMDTPRIRHIAICTKDPAGTAAFYEAAFGVEVIESSETEEYRVVFCTDGSISIALLDFKSDAAAAKFNVDGGASFVGIHHMGFMVEDTGQMLDYLQSMEVRPINEQKPKASEGAHFEAKIRDPNGIVIDIARTWPGLESAHAT
jgi:methylmalonyl-CoA/ethylmalonyl-CoA epimerase